MKINLKENKNKNDIEILIEYPEMSETVRRIETVIKSVDNIVRCQDDDGKICFVRVSEIFYIESVEKQVYIYTKDKVYSSDSPLYQFAEKLYNFGFEQISKSCVLNLNTMVGVKAISRNFIPSIKKRLEKML